MAYLESLTPLGPLDRSRPHSVSDATWRVASRNGERVLQIDTYGSPERQTREPSVSRSSSMSGRPPIWSQSVDQCFPVSSRRSG